MARRGPKPRPPFERFADKIQIEPDGCWTWIGAKDSHGYGQLGIGGRRSNGGYLAVAHRWSYEHFVGPIPDGMDIDHLCHNESDCPGGYTCRHHSCVNPTHLEPVTHAENVRRGRWDPRKARAGVPKKTHCPAGHAYETATTEHV